MRDMNASMTISEYEKLQECRKWSEKIPALHFEKEWDVKIIPPFGGDIIRFTIDYNNKHVSVYFDGYSELGFMCKGEDPDPYFEYCDGCECYRYFLNKTDEMMTDIKRFLES